MNPVSFKSLTPERPAMASETEASPHPPCRNYYQRAVVSFESGGQVIALGNISRESQGDDIKVAFAIKHRSTELPSLGFRVRLKCDPMSSHLYRNFKFLDFSFKYHNDCFDSVHHTADEKEKEEFLAIMFNDAVCKEVVNDDKLYVVKLFKKENRGPEVTGYGSPFFGADVKVNDTYNNLSFVQASSIVTVWLFKYENLAFHVQWALEHLKTAGSKPCYHHLLSNSRPEHEHSVFIAANENGAALSVTK